MIFLGIIKATHIFIIAYEYILLPLYPFIPRRSMLLHKIQRLILSWILCNLKETESRLFYFWPMIEKISTQSLDFMFTILCEKKSCLKFWTTFKWPPYIPLSKIWLSFCPNSKFLIIPSIGPQQKSKWRKPKRLSWLIFQDFIWNVYLKVAYDCVLGFFFLKTKTMGVNHHSALHPPLGFSVRQKGFYHPRMIRNQEKHKVLSLIFVHPYERHWIQRCFHLATSS